jgi:hypothetical protein
MSHNPSRSSQIKTCWSHLITTRLAHKKIAEEIDDPNSSLGQRWEIMLVSASAHQKPGIRSATRNYANVGHKMAQVESRCCGAIANFRPFCPGDDWFGHDLLLASFNMLNVELTCKGWSLAGAWTGRCRSRHSVWLSDRKLVYQHNMTYSLAYSNSNINQCHVI